MKKILFILLTACSSLLADAQYYYKDILTTGQASQQYKLFRQQQVKKVTLESFEGNSPESAGFTGVQEIDLRKGTVTTTTATTVMGDSWLRSSFNADGNLVLSEDSAQNAYSRNSYTYDAAGRLTGITSLNRSDNITTTETHTWTYDSDGRPRSMLRVRDQSDSTRVSFVLDENGNVVEEKVDRANLPTVIVYYYYDSQNRLTDVVRFNARAQRLLPDYMFEYNEGEQLKKMVVIPEGSNEYQTWYYQYNPNGLKRMELVYDKAQRLLGKVQYGYE